MIYDRIWEQKLIHEHICKVLSKNNIFNRYIYTLRYFVVWFLSGNILDYLELWTYIERELEPSVCKKAVIFWQ